MNIIATLRSHRTTLPARIVLWGSLVQLPAALFIGSKAWTSFPHEISDELLMACLVHLAIPLVLAATFVKTLGDMDFRPSVTLNLYLFVIACTPFCLSLPLTV